jgi:hypothetical protein
MPTSLWSDPGTWIALGISALFLVVALVMHRVIMKVLKGSAASVDPSASAPSISTPHSKATEHE